MNDSDIFSINGPVDSWREALDMEAPFGVPRPQVPSSGLPKYVTDFFDNPNGVVRDARFFQARFCAVHATADDLHVLLKSESTPAKFRQLARDLQGFLRDAVLVNEHALVALKMLWSENDSDLTSAVDQGRMFLAKICMAAYLDPSWQQVIELTYIAIEENAIDTLIQCAPIKGRRLCPSKLPFVDHDQLLALPKALRHSSSKRDMLLAAINQRCLVINSKCVLPNERTSVSNGDSKPITGGISALATDRKGEIRDIVLSLYDRFKIGMREPCEPFLRRASCAGERPSTRNETSFWHDSIQKRDPTDLITQEYNIVALRGTVSPVELCLYLLDGPSDYNKPCSQQPLKMDFQRHYAVHRWDTERNRSRQECSSASFERDFQNYVTIVARNSDSLLKGLAKLSDKEKFLIRNTGEDVNVQRTG
jgi:hypothetical protein